MPASQPSNPTETGFPHPSGAHTPLSPREDQALDQWVGRLPTQPGTLLLTHDHEAGSEALCRALIRRLPETYRVAWVLKPRLSLLDFMRAVCHAFRMHAPPQDEHALDAWDGQLLTLVRASRDAGKTVLLVINDAHQAPFFALNHLCRLNTNASDGQPLMHIVLLGHRSLLKQLEQPELAATLDSVVSRCALDTSLAPQEAAAPPVSAEAFPALDDEWLTGGPVPPIDPPQPFPAVAPASDAALTPPDAPTYAASTTQSFPRPPQPGAVTHRAARRRMPSVPWTRAVPVGVLLLGLIAWWAWPTADEAPALAQPIPAPTTQTQTDADAPSRLAAGQACPRESVGGVTVAPDAQPPLVAAAAQTPPTDASPTPTPTTEPSAPAPRLETLVDDQTMTWPHLGTLWGVTLSGESACEQALAQGVQCFRSNGLDIDELRRMDRPSMLLLHQDGTDKWVRVLALDNTHARMASSGLEWSLPLNELQALWKSGALATLWRLPPGQTRRVFSAGPQDPAGRWLDAQLRALQDAGQLKASEDSYLARVTAFQQANNLRSDGRATPTTFVLVNGLRRTDEPRLLETSGR